MPKKLYSTGSSAVIILTPGLLSCESGIERGCLAASRRSGDQHHAVGFFNGFHKILQRFLIESQLGEVQLQV